MTHAWLRGALTLWIAVLAAACAGPAPSPRTTFDTVGPSISPAATPPAPTMPLVTASPPVTPPVLPFASVVPTPTTAPEPANLSPALPVEITARVELAGPDGYRRTVSAVAGQGAIWVSLYQHVAAWLVRIDPLTGAATKTFTLPERLAPATLALGSDGVLLAAGPTGLTTGGAATPDAFVARIDPATGAVLAQAAVPLQGTIATGLGAVWVSGGPSLRRLDAASLAVTATYGVAGSPATACGLSATQTADTSTLRFLDPATGSVTSTIDLGVDGRLLGDDPIDGGPNCVALAGPPPGGDPATSLSTLDTLAAEPTMIVAGRSPGLRGTVRFAAGVFWLIENGAMTPVDAYTLAPLGETWRLPPEVGDLSSWTLLGAGGTVWWVGPTEALRLGITIPPQQATGQVASDPWSGPFIPDALAFDGAQSGVLVGATGSGAGAGVVAVTGDGGRSWSRRILGSPPLTSVAEHGSLLLAAATCRIDAPPGCRSAVLRSADGGSGWAATGASSLDGLGFAPDGTAWAIDTVGGGVALSRDGGLTWQRQPGPCPSAPTPYTPTGISAASASAVWLSCQGGAAMGSSGKALLRSSDGGATWRTMFNVPLTGSGGAADPLLGGEQAAIDFLADGSGWLWTGDGLYATRDGGATWRLLGFQEGSGALSILGMHLDTATSGQVLIADGSGSGRVTLLSTIDGGSAWTRINVWPLSQ